MDFDITSFQSDIKYTFDISYKVDLYLSEAISEWLSALNPGFDLVFSISCYGDNPDKLVFKGKTHKRTKPKEITQFLSFPHNDLTHVDDWVFKLKTFDFERKEKAYRTYPLDKYVKLVIESLKQFFQNEKVENSLDFDLKMQELINHFNQSPVEFAFMNEELMNLTGLINGTHGSGQEWRESEIGKKWMLLKDKYSFDQNGQLIKR